jgi:hypothetical protein
VAHDGSAEKVSTSSTSVASSTAHQSGSLGYAICIHFAGEKSGLRRSGELVTDGQPFFDCCAGVGIEMIDDKL